VETLVKGFHVMKTNKAKEFWAHVETDKVEREKDD